LRKEKVGTMPVSRVFETSEAVVVVVV